MSYPNIPEEELKNKVAQDYFYDYDCTKIIGKVDFCVLPKKDRNQTELFREQSLLWAEAKANQRNSIEMFAQLILTIGKARTFTQHLPPAFLGVFDAEKIAFVPYEKVSDLFYKNDFNWNVAPSNHTTKEFAEIKSLINDTLDREKYLYHFGKDDKLLKIFIKQNLAKGTESTKIQIDEHNFVSIFHRWQKDVKQIIDFDFDKDKRYKFLDANFFLADLFVDDKDTITIADDVSIKEDLFVVFRSGQYEINKENLKELYNAIVKIKNVPAYENFWKRYKRPPIKKYQNYILDRKDLLVPQDFRERKGAFFTPQKWVELSQKYIANVLGKNWQEEYYVWDCCAGTGNLLVGLTNSRNIYASTLDQSDINAIKELNKSTEKMLENNIFQFDFLNDDFFDHTEDFYNTEGKKVKTEFIPSKLPKSLQEIIKDPEKRKKLLVYINPPYVEAGNSRTIIGTGANKVKVATDNKIYNKYKSNIGKASNEIFAQFLIRIYYEIPTCKIANFSKLKNLQAPNFKVFRKNFKAKLKKLFLIPANTFDNVKGLFPIGFFIWDGLKQEGFKTIIADVYDRNEHFIKEKKIINYDGSKYISDWLGEFVKKIEPTELDGRPIGHMASDGNDFQNQNYLLINQKTQRPFHGGGRHTLIYVENIHIVVIYYAVRHCIKATWINDRDQFLYPKDSWKNDKEFHNDCLVFVLFHSQNRITSKEGINHWIPFAETEIGAKETFASDFMSRFIAGKIKKSNGNGDLFNKPKIENGTKCTFSRKAQDVFDAGKELWRYYHSQHDINVNASLYDIREYFQGRNEKTNRMNNTSTDQKYNELMRVLREKLTILADKIAEKVYLHGFLKE